jgi:TonB family protein
MRPWFVLPMLVACGGAAPLAEKETSVVLPSSSATSAASAAPPPTDTADDGICRAEAPRPCADPDANDPRPLGAGASIQGKLAPEEIARVVRSHLGAIRLCFERALNRDPNLRGTVKVKFVIGPDGKVRSADDAGSQMASTEVVECVRDAFRKLTFPPPDGGTVTVVYPIVFEPS